MTLLSFILINNSFGQEPDSLRCNVAVLVKINERIDNISEKLMLKFLQTFGQECKNNVEFSEFGNETLFKVIQNQPEQFCTALEKYQSKIDLEIILLEIENPINDLIGLNQTKKIISDIKMKDELKLKLNNSFDRAINNTK